jgi:HEAT repeat protein
MDRSFRMVWIVLGVLVLAGAGYYYWRDPTPTPPPATDLESLLTELSSAAADERSHAQAAIVRGGTNFIPDLIKLLEPAPIRSPKGLEQMDSTMKQQRLRQQVILAFDLLGASATSAVPELTRLLSHTNSAPYAARALASVGAETPLRQFLETNDPSMRANAALGIGNLKTNAPSTLAALIKATKDADAVVRANAATALGKLASAPEDTIPALAGLLKDTEASVRIAAAKALGKLRLFDAAAMPALEEVKNDRDPQVRRAVRRAISELKQSNRKAPR